MDSRKRSRKGVGHSSTSSLDTGKRQRVACACDQCRHSRERCDGGQPQCSRCRTQDRVCVYTPRVKRRGVPMGYLRAVEQSLAWLVDEVPGCERALHRLLSDRRRSARLLRCGDQEGHRLQQQWAECSIHDSITKVLSDDVDLSTDPAASENDLLTPRSESYVDLQTSQSAATPAEGDSSTHLITLPTNWRELINIYHKSTHCWFPLVNVSDINVVAEGYPQDGIKHDLPNTPSPYAELWAVLAVAAFQDPTNNSENSTTSAQQVYSTAGSLVPSEEDFFEAPHLHAMLLHTLVFVGQGQQLAAWLYMGTTIRLSLHLKCAGLLLDDGPPAGHRMRAACFILDTLISASLGYPSTFNPDSATIHETEDGLRRSHDMTTSDATPQETLRQLFRFCCLMGKCIRGDFPSMPTIRDVVESLAPAFASCNTVFGSSESSSPQVVLVNLAFLVTSIHISSASIFRTSLANRLMEVVQCCTASLGLKGTPPLVVGLLGIFQRSQHFKRLNKQEQSNWQTVMHRLKSVWKQQIKPPSHALPVSGHHHYAPARNMDTLAYLPSPDICTPSSTQYGELYSESSPQQPMNVARHDTESLLPQTLWEAEVDALLSPLVSNNPDGVSSYLEFVNN